MESKIINYGVQDRTTTGLDWTGDALLIDVVGAIVEEPLSRPGGVTGFTLVTGIDVASVAGTIGEGVERTNTATGIIA